MAHIIDSSFYGDGFSTAEMRAVFDETARFQRWLDIEAALAGVQAGLGVIPPEAAREIQRKCRVELIDLDRVREGIRETDHSFVPLLREVQRICENGHGEFLHYGATTQDIEDTGAVLEMRDAFEIVRRDTKACAARLADLAEAHRDTHMAGRTHGQQALVTTFGYRVAVCLREVVRHLERMRDARGRLFCVSLFGGVGTMSVLPRGPETLEALAKQLDLAPAEISWHTARDSIAEYVTLLAMVASTFGKIANEFYALAKTEFGELAEAHTPGKTGSSTMPHKRNPESCEQAAMLARLTKHQAAVALESMVVEHDRDARGWRLDWVAIPEVSCYTAATLRLCLNVLGGLEVRVDRMRENLRLQKDFLFSEALMMELGKKLGKQSAHHVVYEAAMEAHDLGQSIIDRLVIRSEVAAAFDRAALESLLEPARHVGFAPEMIDRAVARSRAELAAL